MYKTTSLKMAIFINKLVKRNYKIVQNKNNFKLLSNLFHYLMYYFSVYLVLSAGSYGKTVPY
jgi:ABC-type amino acid transport system permease subunit